MLYNIKTLFEIGVKSMCFSLPYIEATIRESMRYDTLVPSGLPHTATADTKFMGYDIPKVNHKNWFNFCKD